jgi:hypothetical protein
MLSIDDSFELEGSAVGSHKHGTAMVSAVVHDDNNACLGPSSRKLNCNVNMLYAPARPGQPERIPDLLPADMLERAILPMRSGDAPTLNHVLIVNAWLNEANKPFSGRLSGWAWVVDHLAATYGILSVISPGNHPRPWTHRT